MKKLCIVLAALLCTTMLLAGCGGDRVQEKPEEPFNYDALPFYSADAITSASYRYTDAEMAIPYWLGNVMYNESVMFIKNEGGAKATTLFKPLKVLSVRDWTLKTEYKEGIDYEVEEDGTISVLPDSSIAVFEDGWQYGIGIPDEYEKVNDADVTGNKYRVFDCVTGEGDSIGVIYTEGQLIYSYYLNVTYVYDPAQVDYSKVKTYDNELSGLTKKLQNGEPIKMLVFGDSISEGCSASKHWGRDPSSPFYGEIVKNELERLYDANITLYNYSLGGSTSKWGCGLDTSNNGGYNPTKIRELAPDLVIIGFGMNDAGRTNADDFAANIKMIADNIRSANPESQIVFLNSYPGQEYFVNRTAQKLLRDALEDLSYEYDDATFIDMYTLGLNLFEVKKNYELTVNGVNHPNDFMHRVYAMNILCSMIDYTALAANQ